MATGRILQFDHERGYGFIAADDGGEDVFLHTSVVDSDAYELAPGARLEFKVMAGDRGRKAFAAHLIPDEPGAAGKPVPAPPRQAPAPVPAAQPAASAQAGSTVDDDEPTCDVLSPDEFVQELTELLLSGVPALSGQQVVDVRRVVLGCAEKHQWIDG